MATGQDAGQAVHQCNSLNTSLQCCLDERKRGFRFRKITEVFVFFRACSSIFYFADWRAWAGTKKEPISWQTSISMRAAALELWADAPRSLRETGNRQGTRWGPNCEQKPENAACVTGNGPLDAETGGQASGNSASTSEIYRRRTLPGGLGRILENLVLVEERETQSRSGSSTERFADRFAEPLASSSRPEISFAACHKGIFQRQTG
jgi:hypothetical protein